MATNNFTTRTASLRATKIDTSKIILKGKNILDYITESKTKVLDDRGEFVTDQDLWGTTVTTDENGVVHVSHKFLSNPNGEEAWNSEVKSVKDNKAYTSTGLLCNIQTEMIKDGSYMFYWSPLTSFRSDLSSLVNGRQMFRKCSLESFISDLSSLVNGSSMFYGTSLESFSGDLNSLISGYLMFYQCTNLTSFNGDLSSLVDGQGMFSYTSLASFNGDLSSLVNGRQMFRKCSLESFISDLSSLVNGRQMFYESTLTSFDGDLNSLVDGQDMFYGTSLASFNGDLSSLVDGLQMFSQTSLESFSSDLSSLVSGYVMFSKTHKRGYTISHYKLVDGVRTKVTEHFRAEGLTSFSGDLGSLQGAWGMFGNGADVTYETEEGVTETTKNITPLDEQSVMIIADTIKDLNGFTDWNDIVNSAQRGIIHIGYDSEVCDAANIEEYCTEIMNKGWTVYLNGTVQTTDEGIEGAVTTDEDGTITVTPVPYYCKPLEVEQKEAEWTDGEKYYIILGAQKVFGDDLSTYGMFTSIENAAMNMGFTPYKYVEEEEEAQAQA